MRVWRLLQPASLPMRSVPPVLDGFALPTSVGLREPDRLRSHHGDCYGFFVRERGERSEEAEPGGGRGSCTAMGHAQLSQETGDMGLDCPRSHEELTGDLRVGVVLAQQP